MRKFHCVIFPAAVAATVAMLAAPTLAQGFDIRSWFGLGTTGSVPASQTPAVPQPART